MKNLIYLSITILVLSSACGGDDNGGNNNNLGCEEYWAAVAFADFCGLTVADFDFNTPAVDNCRADQNSTFAFTDLVSIRVYNAFTEDDAKDDIDNDRDFAQSLPNYTEYNNIGNEAFGDIKIEFGKLDQAYIWARKGQYTLYLEVNGDSSNGSNNCFDETSVLDFARALLLPL